MSDPPVAVRADGERRAGRAVDLRDMGLDPAAVATAVRAVDEHRSRTDGSDTGGRAVTVECPPPGPVHEYVGRVGPERGLKLQTALAVAARSRGDKAPQDEERERVCDALDDLTVPAPPDLQAPRERLAGTDTAVDRIRERVAALRGRVQAGREAGRDVGDLEAELAEATRELSERETERAAAREALERAERRARESRDARERRRKLADRRANLERDARAHLVERIRPEYEAALDAVPEPNGQTDGTGVKSDQIDPSATDAARAALAVARVAAVDAPVVLACDRFETPTAATEWLDAPVLRV